VEPPPSRRPWPSVVAADAGVIAEVDFGARNLLSVGKSRACSLDTRVESS
jgi:hypothetical protein